MPKFQNKGGRVIDVDEGEATRYRFDPDLAAVWTEVTDETGATARRAAVHVSDNVSVRSAIDGPVEIGAYGQSATAKMPIPRMEMAKPQHPDTAPIDKLGLAPDLTMLLRGRFPTVGALLAFVHEAGNLTSIKGIRSARANEVTAALSDYLAAPEPPRAE